MPQLWWVVLLTALVVQGMALSRRIDRVQAVSDRPTWSVDAPQAEAESPTGWSGGQRRQIVPGHHNPSFWWITEAQQAAATGAWRVRHIDHDAAPDGRETRRTAPYRWWLTAVGAVTGVLTGVPMGAGIERGTLVADPLLWLVLLVGGTLFCARRGGTASATAFALGGAMLFPLAGNFQPGAPDPRSLGWLLAIGGALLLWGANGRRWWMVVAGVLGGVGLWNEAATQMPVVLATAVGALAWVSLGKPTGQGGGWRAWAMGGAGVTVLASGWEFGPVGMWDSMAAVSPWHALVWLGMGEVLTAVESWRRGGGGRWSVKQIAGAVGGGVAVLVWPVMAWTTAGGGLWAPDFYALELANHPRGGVAPDLATWLRRAGDGGAGVAILLPLLLVVGAAVRAWRCAADTDARGRIVFGLGAVFVALALAVVQLRWWNLVDGFVLVLLASLFAGVKLSERRTLLALGLVTGCLLPGFIVGFPPAVRGGVVEDLSPLEAQSLVARDYAAWTTLRAGDEPVVLFSTPIFAGAVAYYGGFRAVVSSDDENRTGNLAAVRLASAMTAQEVDILLDSRGVTHIALPLWDPGLDQLVRIGANLGPGDALPPNAFAVSLRWWDMPLTVRPLDYLIPKEDGFGALDLRAFAVGAEQTPEVGLSRLADFFVQRGQVREAVAMRENLEKFARHPAVLGAMANIDFAARDGAKLTETLERLVPMLGRRAARDLPPDRRISLAALLVRVKREELARAQLAACMQELDAPTLRGWTPGEVINLLALSRAQGVAFPTTELETLALALVPPQVRTSLQR